MYTTNNNYFRCKSCLHVYTMSGNYKNKGIVFDTCANCISMRDGTNPPDKVFDKLLGIWVEAKKFFSKCRVCSKGFEWTGKGEKPTLCSRCESLLEVGFTNASKEEVPF